MRPENTIKKEKEKDKGIKNDLLNKIVVFYGYFTFFKQ